MQCLLFRVSDLCFFFCNDTASTEIYTYLLTLSLHDALPICWPTPGFATHMSSTPCGPCSRSCEPGPDRRRVGRSCGDGRSTWTNRSEEHTSELQSLMRISYAVFCLKKKTTQHDNLNNLL